MEPILKKFLCFFYSKGALIHLLHCEMCHLLKFLMGRFLKSQVLKDTEGKHLLTVKYSKSDNLLSNSKIKVVENTCCTLSKLTIDQQKVALTSMKLSYVETTEYLIVHLSIDNKSFRDVSFLHPNVRDSEHGAQATCIHRGGTDYKSVDCAHVWGC